MSGNISRRSVLIGGAAAAGVLSGVLGHRVSQAAPTGLPNPFTLGVASGDPSADGVVLWTRLAPQPLAEDGMGGMPNRVVRVDWEVAADEGFRTIVQRGTADAAPELGHSVHVELAGLRPGAEYFYRFRTEGHLSPAGRTRTAPAPGALDGLELTMCFVSCSQYEHGYFTAYRRLAEDHPDLVLHLGDYIYEYKAGDYQVPGGNPRDHAGPETETLANYRQRHAQYKTDPDLQAAHAIAPWAPVFDDHELDNNWANMVPERPERPQPNFAARRAAAFQAYYENMPLRASARPRATTIQLYRRIHWGALATFHMLDTRQYRDDQACGDGLKTCPERRAANRTIVGADQERWLLDGFRESRARWDLLGQQVFFAQLDVQPGPGETNNMDAWDGYAANRDRVVRGWVDAKVRNPVVLTGDVHTAWAADIKQRWEDPASPIVGSELVATSITSGGDGSEFRGDTEIIRLENPHIRYFNNRRGYVRTRMTADRMHADFRAVPYVSRPGAPVQTKASFVIEDRRPGLHPA
ncbi:alkaline phosphatase D family protein [Nocardia sp. CDC159]|uniref:Alkaline phosphatase D family protein n=1 Tax=Nocardia pulmonis TaxID=2951408 RepID=A0A9X2ECF4_9NOCA|nr:MULTISPECIES: alkaline phosphatase D family protein [Nocardia]MCM6778332.1 alkaline phosphatase D family protein [Nocardia pulmonis]MCM6791272.1 alkaline phosphatase D family protein [Nocardia sp. CDC159]